MNLREPGSHWGAWTWVLLRAGNVGEANAFVVYGVGGEGA